MTWARITLAMLMSLPVFLSLPILLSPWLLAAPSQAAPTSAPPPTPAQTPGPATTVSVALSPTSIVANGTSTTTATATVTDANENPVSGQTVKFTSTDPGETVGNTAPGPSPGTYVATITSSTTIGASTITASDTSVAPAVQGSASLSQAAYGSSTSVSAAPSAAVTNQTVTLSATVTSSAGAPVPSGQLTFMNGATPIHCTSGPETSANLSVTVTCKTSFAASASPVHLEAVFSSAHGEVLAGSVSSSVALVVSRDSTSTALAVSNPTATTATYTATVTMNDSGSVTPSGSVEFLDGGQPIPSCVSQPLAEGASSTATCTITHPRGGALPITAAYSGDSNFRASTSSPTQSVTRPVLGKITSTMQWTFYHTPSYTKVLALLVNHAPVGSSVIVTCGGKGCPFTTYIAAVTRCPAANQNEKCTSTTRSAPAINLMPSLSGHRLGIGASIVVEIVRPDWVGKHYLFTVRGGKPPAIQIRCLAPGATRAGAGCSGVG